MYESFYGLREKPFSMLPDPGYLYLSRKHQMALTMLEYGLVNHSGFCVVSGETGSGKTTLLRKLLENIEPNITVGMITNTHKGFGELLDWILSAFGIHQQGMSLVDMHQRFVDFVIEQYAANKTTLLIVDEAQNMTVEKLEELRMLSNVNSEQDQVLQVILAGQPELKDTLRLPELKQFAQRISVDYHLGALSKEETAGYIEHRLKTAGADHNIFTIEACELIHEYSGGTPRLINLMCDTVMVYGFADQRDIIDEILVDEMVRERMVDSIVPINKEALARAPFVRKEETNKAERPKVKSKSEKKTDKKISPEPEEKPGTKPEEIITPEENKESIQPEAVSSEHSSEKISDADLTQETSWVNEGKDDHASERRRTHSRDRRKGSFDSDDNTDQVIISKTVVEDRYNDTSPQWERSDSSSYKREEVAARGELDNDVQLRGPNTIAIIPQDKSEDIDYFKWSIGIAIIIFLIFAGFVLSDISNKMNANQTALSSDEEAGKNPDSLSNIVKQQLLEAEKVRQELARMQQEDRDRMKALELEAERLKKERDEALARKASEEQTSAREKAALREASVRERLAKAEAEKARAEAEKAKAEAAAAKLEKTRLLLEAQKAEIAEREKKMQAHEAMIEKTRQDDVATIVVNEPEAGSVKQENITATKKEAATETKKQTKQFRTDPCSSSTARFLSTCR